MCAILDNVLQTDRDKKYEREQDRDSNAQSAHEKFSLFCAKSTKGRVNASNTLSSIASAEIELWKGTVEAFMLHW